MYLTQSRDETNDLNGIQERCMKKSGETKSLVRRRPLDQRRFQRATTRVESALYFGLLSRETDDGTTDRFNCKSNDLC